MRALLAALLLAAATPAGAADWRAYDNGLMGYSVDLPASFAIAEESDTRLVLRDGAATLEVFGLELEPLGFEEAVALAMQSSADEGFAITAQAVTPRWARWTAVDGARQLAVALVPLCGTALAGYELKFTEADGAALQPVIERLTASLRRTRSC
ncbi:MAG: hypothetical protein JNL14_12280 [Devosia sp.]|jgi:hypothetical protein|uniref:hypothetical protein n=1 Tax=Devosia sp. TaxID=1871048 RepID=UPI001A40EC38|nr:hypothetical protein [Devosia sp.]MBL8598507.1 hypothetical protein [Devosia sp.]